MQIIRDFKNDLLKRREILFKLKADSNPGYDGCKKKVIEKFNVPEEHVVIKSTRNNFGTKEFFCEVFIYDSAKHKELIEQKKKEKKKVG